jgi:hypothetical protein
LARLRPLGRRNGPHDLFGAFDLSLNLVSHTGFEPVTSSVSGSFVVSAALAFVLLHVVRTPPPGAAGVDVAESDDIGIPKAALAGVAAGPQQQYGFAGWIVS